MRVVILMKKIDDLSRVVRQAKVWAMRKSSVVVVGRGEVVAVFVALAWHVFVMTAVLKDGMASATLNVEL